MKDTPIQTLLFTGPKCGICQVIKPKLRTLMAAHPEVAHREVEAGDAPEFAARHSVFSVPTLIVLAEGKEYRRYHGAFSVYTVDEDLQRLTQLMK